MSLDNLGQANIMLGNLDEAQAAYDAEGEENICIALAAAKAVRESDISTEGDYKRAIMLLSSALGGKKELQGLIAKDATINFLDYSEYVLNELRAAYNNATTVAGDKNATSDDIKSAYNDLLYWYSLSGDQSVNVAYGKDYTTSKASNGSYPDTNGVELTDGALGNGDDAYSPAWAGFNGASDKKYEIVVDLGEV